MPRDASDFMQEWIFGHISPETPAGALDRLVLECTAAAREADIEPGEIIEETGADIRTLISEAIEHQP